MDTAMEWTRTDPEACRDDVKRLGLEGAAQYNYDLAQERIDSGDDRWQGVTVEAMREALGRL